MDQVPALFVPLLCTAMVSNMRRGKMEYMPVATLMGRKMRASPGRFQLSMMAIVACSQRPGTLPLSHTLRNRYVKAPE